MFIICFKKKTYSKEPPKWVDTNLSYIFICLKNKKREHNNLDLKYMF